MRIFYFVLIFQMFAKQGWEFKIHPQTGEHRRQVILRMNGAVFVGLRFQVDRQARDKSHRVFKINQPGFRHPVRAAADHTPGD